MKEVLSMTASSAGLREVSLRDLVAPLFRHKLLLILVFVATAAAVLAAGFVIPRPYKSHMAILVRRERLDPVVSPEATTQVPSSGAQEITVEEINSEAELLLSQDLLEKVVVATGLDKTSSPLAWLFPARSEAQRIEHAAKNLAKDLSIKNETNSNLISVSYKSSNPKLAFAVLSALGNFYVEKHMTVLRPPGSFQFFAQQTEQYHKALQQAEANLEAFNKSNKVAAPDDLRTDLAQQVATTTGDMYSARQAAAADEQRIRSDQAQMRGLPQRSVSQRASAPADKLLEDLGASLIAAETHRTELLTKYDPGYPLVQEANQEIAQIKATIAETEKRQYVTETTDVDPEYELLREDIARTRADLAAQRAGAAAAARNITGMRNQMVTLDAQSIEQSDLEREVKADEENYLLYLSKREQERTTDALDKTKIGNVSIVVPPSIPALPLYSSPMVILVAFFAGLFFSIASAYLVDYFDSSFHSPTQVEDILGIPFVVAVPRKTA